MSINFDKKAFNINPIGHKVYWMTTSLRSDSPNGQYKIEKMNSRHWSITHHQVTGAGVTKIVRALGMATTLEVAVRYCELDEQMLAEKVLDALLKRPSHLTMDNSTRALVAV